MRGDPKHINLPNTPRWYAVRTRYKCEKWVAGLLRRNSVDVYLPLNVKIKKYTRKIKRVELPLISCYVFVRISEKDFAKVLATEYVVGFIKFSGRFVPIPEEEINLLQKIVGEFQDMDSSEEMFETGEPVEVIAGNLTGLRGSLIQIKGKKEFVVELESIAHSLIIHVDPSHLRKVRPQVRRSA